MNSRKDRLGALHLLLRDGRLHRAQDLADRLGVSVRTIYRDMDTLMASGIPIAGERGLGYMTTADVTLPPLNLTRDELAALVAGLAALRDSNHAAAADSLMAKLDPVLPGGAGGTLALSVYPFDGAAQGFQHVPAVRGAIRAHQKLRLNLDGSEIVIRPLYLDYWGRAWTLLCWSETGDGFRRILLDRIEKLRVLPQLFRDEPGRTLADYNAGAG